MHQPNHNDEDFFDLLDRPEGVVPKNFEASPLSLGEKLVKSLPSKHKDPKKASEQERGLKNLIDFVVPQTPVDAALATLPIGALAKVGAKGLKKGKRLVEKLYREMPVREGTGIAPGTPRFQRGQAQRNAEFLRINPEDTKAIKDYNIKYGYRKDPSPPDDIVMEGGYKSLVYRRGSDKFPKIDVNDKLFKEQHSGFASSDNIIMKDKSHTVFQKTRFMSGKKLKDESGKIKPKDTDVLYHEFSALPKGAERYTEEVAGLSFRTRRVGDKDALTFGRDAVLIEDINFSSGVKRSGSGGPMGYRRDNLTNAEELAADKGAVKLLVQTFKRLPKNSIVIFDEGKDNTMTREALMLMINSAGKMAKRIIFDATNSTRVRVNYDITGSGKNLDKLSSEEFAEMIFQKVEKANKNFKVSGKLFVEKDAIKNNWLKMSSVRIELAAAIGIPLSQFDKFMEDASE